MDQNDGNTSDESSCDQVLPSWAICSCDFKTTGADIKHNDVVFAIGVAAYFVDDDYDIIKTEHTNIILNINPDRKPWPELWREKCYDRRGWEDLWSMRIDTLDGMMNMYSYIDETDMWGALFAFLHGISDKARNLCFVWDRVSLNAMLIERNVSKLNGVLPLFARLDDNIYSPAREVCLRSYFDAVFRVDPLDIENKIRSLVKFTLAYYRTPLSYHVPSDNAHGNVQDFLRVRRMVASPKFSLTNVHDALAIGDDAMLSAAVHVEIARGW